MPRKVKPTELKSGDRVVVLDHSNGRELAAVVRKVDRRQKQLEVYVERFKTLMTFDEAWTRRGRFQLLRVVG